MKEIIERLSLLKGTDKEVDEAIAAALVGVEIEWSNVRQRNVYHADGLWVSIGEIKPYTASIDAAMSLVPEGWTVARIAQNDDKSWFVELREGFLTSYNRVAMSPLKTSTPAIALCIAALKARDNE